MNNQGSVVGIVVSKLGTRKLDNIPQNVNYAIKGSYALSLLETYSDKLAPEPEQKAPLNFEETVEKVKDSVVLIFVYE